MVTLIAYLARRFDRRVSSAFVLGLIAGAALLVALLVVHFRHSCSPLGLPGFVVCKVA